jgi:hypothetical protein
MHHMGRKMDHLEQSIGDLLHDAGLDGRKENGLSWPSSMEEDENKNPTTAGTSIGESSSKSPPKPAIL